jgi:hypothetical protein
MIIKINKELVYSSCIMYFVKQFAIFENGNFPQYKSDKGKGQNAMSQIQSILHKALCGYTREKPGKCDKI